MSDAPREGKISRAEWYLLMRHHSDPDSELRSIEEAADGVHRSVEEARSWLSEINDRWWLGPVILGICAALVLCYIVAKVYLG